MIFKQEQFDPPPILSSWTQGLRALQFTRKYYARSHTTSTVALLFMRGSSTCPALRWMDVIPAMSFLLRYKINACTHGCLCMHGENTEQKCTQCRLSQWTQGWIFLTLVFLQMNVLHNMNQAAHPNHMLNSQQFIHRGHHLPPELSGYSLASTHNSPSM